MIRSFDRNILYVSNLSVTYDHRLKETGHPVRSAIHKLEIGRLVVGWVTTSESLLLYVFFWVFFGILISLRLMCSSKT